jgi:hypothetical protein
MEGGIALLLLLLLVIIGIVVAAFMYLSGGALTVSERRARRDNEASRARPVHKAPHTPEEDRVHFIGTPEGDEAERRERAAQRAD